MTTKNITLSIESGIFKSFFQRAKGDENFNISEISQLRRLFDNEKARILYTIKTQNPESIYQLTKLLGRKFGPVKKDINLLRKFGIVELDSMPRGKREVLKQILAVDNITIKIYL